MELTSPATPIPTMDRTYPIPMCVSFGWVLGSGSSLSFLRNKCYCMMFGDATFVVLHGRTAVGNNSNKRSVRQSKRLEYPPRPVMPHNTCLLLSGLVGWRFGSFLASSL